jgi:N-glycosylase/DNA lyase
MEEQLIEKITNLKNSEVGKIVENRVGEFREIRDKGENAVFSEMCFCILTANYTSEGGIRVQREIGEGFLHLDEENLAKRLKEIKYRFPNLRAKYIVKSREKKTEVFSKIKNEKNTRELREFLVENIYGFGMKEASHFLRNIGILDFAVLDFHIIEVLQKYKIIEKPKTITKKKYLEIEEKLERISKKCEISQGELDFYLWYLETGKILK